MLNYLRIAVTAICLTACVLLVALWVRSGKHHDAMQASFPYLPPGFMVISCDGQLMCFVFSGERFPLHHFQMSGSAVESWKEVSRPSRWGFAIGRFNNLTWLCVPHWCLTAVVIAPTAVVWLRWRFSLRALLIATTLVGVVLGVIVASR
jgi:hypothetical protein